MKKLVLFIAVLIVLCVSGAYAQKQSGVVKTRGRMENGKLVPGTPLPGATLKVNDGQIVLAKDGKFSFPVKDGKYTLKSVSKQGYNLVDAEACRQYQYSKNPLTIVMEQPEQQRSDQLATERKLRRELQRRIQQREDEIDALNASVEEKNRMLVQLNKEREENEKIIETMAKYYATLDYDQLDAFQRQVSELLENGSLERADSLLRTRGGMDSRIAHIQQEQKALAEAQAAQSMRQKRLDESKAGTQRKLETIAADCYSFYQRFLMAHQNDSAAYYLELRASLDTTNVEWLREAGNYIRDYLADYDRAMELYNIAMRQAKEQNGENSQEMALCYYDISRLHLENDEYSEAMDFENKALSFFEKDSNNIKVAMCNNEIGQNYFQQSNYKEAEHFFSQAATLLEKEPNTDNIHILSSLYVNMSECKIQMLNFLDAKQLCHKAIEIGEKYYGEEHFNIALYYIGMGRSLVGLKEYDEADYYLQKGLRIGKKILGEKNPKLIVVYNNLGNMYFQVGDFSKSIKYSEEALSIGKSAFGEKHTKIANSLFNLSVVYGYKLKDYDKSLNYLKKAKDIYINIYGTEHDNIANCLKAMGDIYDIASKHDSALLCYQQSLDIRVKKYGEGHVNVAQSYTSFGYSCYQHGDIAKGVELFEKGVNIMSKQLNSDHPKVIKAKEVLEQMKQKLDEQQKQTKQKNKKQ